MASTIELEAVTKYFGETHAVGPVSLSIKEGEFFSLLGPSGCGKTTILRLIAGFEDASGGTIRIGDRVVNATPVEQRGVGMVFQNYALFPHLSVFENVAFGLRLRRSDRPDIERRVKDALALVGLEDLGERMPGQMSGGQQQRAALARALVVEPSVLLLDEPLSNLDLKLREQMRSEIRSLQRRLGITMVYVTHDQGEAMAVSDRTAVMNLGRVEQVGTPRQIYEQPATLFVAGFIGQCNFFSGTVTSADGGRARFTTDAGCSFIVSSGYGADHQRDVPMTLVIRPEAVTLGAEAVGSEGAPNRLPARIEEFVYLGEKIVVTVSLMDDSGRPAERLMSSQHTFRDQELPRVGETVLARIPPEECILVEGGSAGVDG